MRADVRARVINRHGVHDQVMSRMLSKNNRVLAVIAVMASLGWAGTQMLRVYEVAWSGGHSGSQQAAIDGLPGGEAAGRATVLSSDVLPGPPTVCGVGWDPAASAEAEALATVGSLQHNSYGERRLQRADQYLRLNRGQQRSRGQDPDRSADRQVRARLPSRLLGGCGVDT